MPQGADGTKVSEQLWERLISSSIPSYTIFKENSDIYAEANFPGGTDYSESSAVDDSTIIQNVIHALESSGGLIFLKRADYNIKTQLEIEGQSGITIDGEGGRFTSAGLTRGTVLLDYVTDGTDKHCIYAFQDGSKGGRLTLRNFGIKVMDTKASGAAEIYLGENVDYSRIQNVNIWLNNPKGKDGIYLFETFGTHIQDVTVYSPSFLSNGLVLDGNSSGSCDVYVSRYNFYLTNRAGRGIWVKWTNGFQFSDTDLLNAYVGLLIAPEGGKFAQFGFLDRVMADLCYYGFWITNEWGGSVKSMELNNCWGCSAAEYNADVPRSGCGFYIKGVDLVTLAQARVMNNEHYGIYFDGTRDIKILGCTISGNSQKTNNTWSGIYVAADTDDFFILDNKIGDTTLFTEKQKYGIEVASGTSDYYIVKTNDLRGNVTGAISDGGSGTNKYVELTTFPYQTCRLKTGNYTGDGEASKAVTGVGFQPKFCIIFKYTEAIGDTYYASEPWLKTEQTYSDFSVHVPLGRIYTGRIISLDSDGFTVGSALNNNAQEYEYTCMG